MMTGCRRLAIGSALWLVAIGVLAQTWGFGVRDLPAAPGVEITAVGNGTPAERAGLREGDLLLRVDGAPIAGAREFARKMALLPVGSVVALAASRQGWEREVRVELAGVDVGFGITVVDSAAARGPLVVRVEPGSVATIVGVEPGDAITELSGRRVANSRDLQSLRVADGRRLVLTLARGQRITEVTLASGAAPPGRGASVTAPAPPGTPGPSPAAGVAGSVVDEIVEANRQYEAGRWNEAEAGYAKVVATVRDVPMVWGRLCHVRVMQGRFVEALETCREAASLLPRDATVYQNAGYSLSRLGRHAEAIVEYQKVIALAPERIEPYRSIAGGYFALRNWAKAEENFREVVKRDPTSQSAWQSLGDSAGELGNSTEAINSYRKALELGPGSASLHRALGWHLYRAERFAEAEPVLTEARRLNPRDGNTLLTLGSVKYKLGKNADARDAWQRALELEPNSPIGAIARQSLASVGGAAPLPDAAPRAAPPTSGPRAPGLARDGEAPPDAAEPEIDVGN
jgi:Flp pilus assembly protein TadD